MTIWMKRISITEGKLRLLYNIFNESVSVAVGDEQIRGRYFGSGYSVES